MTRLGKVAHDMMSVTVGLFRRQLDMGNKLTQLALVVVFGLIIILGTFLLFQAWHNNVVPTNAEIEAVVVKATKMNVDDELAELNGPYNNAQSINIAGQVLMVLEALVMAALLIYVLIQPMTVADVEEEGMLQRAYEGY